MRFINVARARDAHAARTLHLTGPAGMVDDVAMSPRSSAELSVAP
jgi:ribonuclease HII